MGSRDGSPGDLALLALGVVGRPHGVRGELTFHNFNPAGTRLEDLALPVAIELRRADQKRPAVLAAARPFKDGSLVYLEGISSREAAATVTGYHLCVPRTELPPLGEDECYTQDLVGCTAVDKAGQERGRVASVFWNGRHEVLAIVDESGAELLVPVVGDFLTSIDLAQRRIVIDPHE